MVNTMDEEFRGIIKFIRIYYNTNSRGFGKFFMDFFTRLTRFLEL